MSPYASTTGRTRSILLAALGTLSVCLPMAAPAQYSQHNLVSDGFVAADHTDSQLINPWGISFSSSSYFWLSDNGTSVSTLYDGGGTKLGLVVTTPDGPTGTVYNGTSDFVVSNGSSSGAAVFLFGDEGGRISGWSPTVDSTNALTVVDNSGVGAEYKGVAIQTGGAVGSRLYAANFSRGGVDMFDGNFNYIGSFTDTTVDPGYAPFNVQSVGSDLFVTFAQVGSGGDEVDGAGLGFVDKFDANGHLIQRISSHGVLNAPWGLAMAPSNFGQFSNDLLVGNFGDGRINAFDPITGAFLGTISDSNGNPIENQGLWGLAFGNGAHGFGTNSLYFTAGPGDEAHGLFGKIDAVPEPASMAALGIGLLAMLRRRRR